MAAIDLAVLGMVLEKPQSAYDIQKDVEYHHFPRWTRISVPSVYRKVLQLEREGYLRSRRVQGGKSGDKAVYSITDKGRERFQALMRDCAAAPAALALDFNVMVANLNKVDKAQALELIGTLRQNLCASAQGVRRYAEEFSGIPLSGRTIFDQQIRLYQALLAWLDQLEGQLAGG